MLLKCGGTSERTYTYDANHNPLDAFIEGTPVAYSYALQSDRWIAIATPTTSQALAQDAARFRSPPA